MCLSVATDTPGSRRPGQLLGRVIDFIDPTRDQSVDRSLSRLRRVVNVCKSEQRAAHRPYARPRVAVRRSSLSLLTELCPPGRGTAVDRRRADLADRLLSIGLLDGY